MHNLGYITQRFEKGLSCLDLRLLLLQLVSQLNSFNAFQNNFYSVISLKKAQPKSRKQLQASPTMSVQASSP